MQAVEAFIAVRYLRARRADGFVSLITGLSFVGIALGVATLIIVMAVMNGFRIELVKRILGVNGHVMISAPARDLPEYASVQQALLAVPGVVRASPMVETQVMITHRDRARGAVLRAYEVSDLAALTPLASNIREGDLQSLASGRALALGVRMATALGVSAGDAVTVLTPRGTKTAFGIMPRSKTYTVGAVFDMGMSLYDDNFLFLDLDEARKFLVQAPSAVEAFSTNADTINKVVPAIRASIGDNYSIVTWQQANDTFFTALAVERNVMFLILSLIILVAALNIISGMTMLVKDKTIDIAVLRTIGASRAALLRIFMLAGALIGVTGTVTGLVIGLLFCRHIEAIRQFISQLLGVSLFDPKVYFLARMPAQVIASDVAFTVGIALLLSVLAAWYPALRASRLQPTEALRYG